MQGRTHRRYHSRRYLTAGSLAVAAFAVGTAISPALGLAGGAVRSPVTFGRIPHAAMSRAGIDWAAAPDYIAVLKRGQVVGYVPKVELDQTGIIGPRNGGTYTPSSSSVLIVVNRSLHIVGHFYPMVGFVPEDSPAPQPAVPPTTVLYGPTVTSVGG